MGESVNGKGRAGGVLAWVAAVVLGMGMGMGLGCAAARGRAGEHSLRRFEFTQPQMGVPFRVVFYAPDAVRATNAAKAVFGRIAALNAILSDYDPDSELNRVCHETPVGEAVKVSSELWSMLDRSVVLSEATGGGFDATLGPLINLWRRARRHGELPSASLIREAQARVGWHRLRLDRRARTVTFLVAGMRLDFGGIAKGYAADEAGRVLREHGLKRYLVAAAGDIVVGDAPPGERGWRVEVGNSDFSNAPPARLVWLRRAAVSTSGDLYQRLEIGGRRYSHIVDPGTGVGLTERSLVTVIARDGTTADSVSTALSVMGAARGVRWVERVGGVSAMILHLPEGGGPLRVWESRDFPAGSAGGVQGVAGRTSSQKN